MSATRARRWAYRSHIALEASIRMLGADVSYAESRERLELAVDVTADALAELERVHLEAERLERAGELDWWRRLARDCSLEGIERELGFAA